MKAHIPTSYEKEREFIREHINRVIKLFCYTLYCEYGWGATRLLRLVLAAHKASDELYEDPEYWERVDDTLIDRLGLPFKREDYDEREESSKIIHKENGKKWRKPRNE